MIMFFSFPNKIAPVRSTLVKEHLFLLRTNYRCAKISQSLGLHSGEFSRMFQAFRKPGFSLFRHPDEL